MSRKEEIAHTLATVRRTTLELLDQVPDLFLRRRVHSFYSPIGWHFGHIGRTEEFWVCEATGAAPFDAHLSFVFADLPDNPKDNRVNIPERQGLVEYLQTTRYIALQALEHANLTSPDPLLRDGYAWEFAIQHECQHQETITEMLCLIQKEVAPWGDATPAPVDWQLRSSRDMVEIPAGTFVMGSDLPFVYDNERMPHEVTVDAFALARTPVTAYDWTRFMQDGGYERKELWSPEGWSWCSVEHVTAPEYWVQLDGVWCAHGMFGLRSILPSEPAMCLSWYEADAFARWAGKRLPTEAEWEYAASGLVERHYPWGDNEPSSTMASFSRNDHGPLPVGSHPKGGSPFGVLDMAGNCWEWTSSPFLPYPGFDPYPYDGYSKDHMDGRHYVCRGGSWATAGPILRCSFRNWYVPSYRQGFLGVRLAA